MILVGYVRLDYCRRKLADVETDIKKYGNWARSGSSFNASMLPTNFDGESGHQSKDYGKSGLGVQGIFFDETPNLFDEDTAAYLDAAGRIVKATEGILYDRLVSLAISVILAFRLCTKLEFLRIMAPPFLSSVVSRLVFPGQRWQLFHAQCPIRLLKLSASGIIANHTENTCLGNPQSRNST